MKKILFFGTLFLSAMTFVACSDDYDDWAEPQSNPQEESVTLPGYTASGVSAIDLASVEGDSVQVLSLSSVSLPEGASVGNTRVEVLPADGSSTEATTISVDNENRVAVADLQSVIETYYGKRPTARELIAQVYSNIILNGQTFRVDAGTITITATPDAPFIASAYYLVGDMTGWEGAPIQFRHSDADVYEDPVFTVTFTANAGNYWQIIPQSNIDNGEFWYKGEEGVVGVAVDGDTSLSGSLTTNDPKSGKFEKDGFYRLTINMLDYTYTIEEVAATYYVYGAIQGWDKDPATGKVCAFYPSSTTVQSYTTLWTGAWDLKFWSATDWGVDAQAYGCENDGDNSATGTIVGGNKGAISAPSAEYYTFTIDMATMTYTWTKCSNQNPTTYDTMGLIGSFNNWDADNDVNMTEVANAPHNWYIRNMTFESDCEVKFRANDAWDVSWGESNNIGDRNYGVAYTTDAPNLNVPAGTYDIYLNDITGEYVFISVE